MQLPRIVRLEQKGEVKGLVNFVDTLLDDGTLGYRRISKKIKDKFNISISHETIRQYDLYRRNLGKSNMNKQSNYSSYYICVRPLNKGKKKGTWKDKVIYDSLRK